MLRTILLAWLALLPLRAQFMTSLSKTTLQEFDAYQAQVDAELAQRTGGRRAFQWVNEQADLRAKVKKGEIATHPHTGKNGKSIQDGLIHDWIGVVFLPAARIDQVRHFLLATEKHKGVFPEVLQARTVERQADRSITVLRVLKKKVVSVQLDLEYENRWRSPDASCWVMSSRTRRVSEWADAGKPSEKLLPPDKGHGFLWRMNSEWRLKQEADGVLAELRVVSLSRDTPAGLGWIVKPVIRNLPADSIQQTLAATQRAIASP